ncbi:MAG: cupin domain-containing protein [Burkholderiaceae bacterium]
MQYKSEGSAPFHKVSRQVLFDLDELGCQWRYFEMAADGHTTLERHQHVHAVMILRGHGQCLVGDQVIDVAPHDLVEVPPLTWHQFRADGNAPMGFLCLVRQDRDRPQLPDTQALARLRDNPAIRAFLDRKHD